MTLATRLDHIEDHGLSPQEAVIAWIREVRQFDSLLAYGRWLAQQPDEAYPLVRMPKQVVEAVRARNKGMKDELLRDQLYHVQKDLLFLYQLHRQVNLRALAEEDAYGLRLALLGEKLRLLVAEICRVDQARLERFSPPPDRARRRPRRAKSEEELALQEEIRAWRAEEALLRGEVSALQEAAGLVSRRYLAGEELLYPAALRRMDEITTCLDELRQVLDRILRMRPPLGDEGFIQWLAREGEPDEGDAEAEVQPLSGTHADIRRSVLALARHFVLMAKAEALDHLGERDAAVELVRDWLCSEEAQKAFEGARG